MKKAVFIASLILCAALLTGCAEKVHVDTDTLKIEQQGRKFAVYDLLGGDVYSLVFTRKGRTDGPESPQTLLETDTIKISRIAGGFETSSAGMVYRITRKLGVLEWLKK